MPIARLVEYKIAIPSEYAFDLLMEIGNEGIFMPISRPGVIPAPRLPGKYVDRIRKAEEIARELSRVLMQYSIPPPEEKSEVKISTFEELLERIIEDGEDLLTRVRQYMEAIETTKAEVERLRGIVDVVSAVGRAVLERFRRFNIDIIVIGEGEFGEFRKAIESHGGEALSVKVGERHYAIVIYPEWSRSGVSMTYRIFNVTPLEVPREVDIEALKTKLKEAESRLYRYEEELRGFLTKVRDRAYAIVDLAEAVMNIVRQYSENAIPEGREIGDKLAQMIESMNELRRRARELEVVKRALETIRQVEMGKCAWIRYRAFVVRGLNTAELMKYTYFKHDIGDGWTFVIILEPPPTLEPQSLGSEVYEVKPEYLTNVQTALNLVTRELNDILSRLRDLEREYEHFIKEFNEVSAYGIEGVGKVSGEVVTIAGYVKEAFASRFDELLSKFLTKFAIDATVRKASKVVYLREIEPEKAPTLEEYPKIVDVFKRIVYMYGVPKYVEVSPVPIAAFLFPLFYGWMYPDLGHGLILTLFGLALWKSRYKGPNKFLRSIFGGKFSDWGLIFFLCGLWAIAFTFVESGTIFGIEVLPAPWMLVHVRKGVLHVLTESVYATLVGSLIVGILSLYASFALKAVNAYRAGERDISLLFYTPLFFFFAFMVLALVSLGIIPVAYLGIRTELLKPIHGLLYAISDLKYVWIVGTVVFLVILIASMLYLKKKYAGVPGFSLAQLAVEVGAEAAIPSLTNTISFMRLAIVAIMHAVFTGLAYGFADSFGLTTPAGIFFLILFNLIIAFGEGFVAFIQSLRLHFYEMFTKFFTGAGVLFTPFLLGLKWVRLFIV